MADNPAKVKSIKSSIKNSKNIILVDQLFVKLEKELFIQIN